MKVKSVAEAALAAVMSAMVGLLCEHVEAAESQLPEGYTPLEYIQSTGQQHIKRRSSPRRRPYSRRRWTSRTRRSATTA